MRSHPTPPPHPGTAKRGVFHDSATFEEQQSFTVVNRDGHVIAAVQISEKVASSETSKIVTALETLLDAADPTPVLMLLKKDIES